MPWYRIVAILFAFLAVAAFGFVVGMSEADRQWKKKK